MKTIRITGVPEHFNYPFRIMADSQPFREKGILINWLEESRGSGKMAQMLQEGETDIALLLTESFLKEVSHGHALKLLGYHVKSPLIWGIHSGSSGQIQCLNDLSHLKFLISRHGSGSELMTKVLAQRENWSQKQMHYQVVQNLEGALQYFSKNPDCLFLWEKFTTMPFVEQGLLNRISEIPSPWPSFVMVTQASCWDLWKDELIGIRDYCYQLSAQLLLNKEESIRQIAASYGLSESTCTAWFSQTQWARDSIIDLQALEKTMHQLQLLGIITKIPRADEFLTGDDL